MERKGKCLSKALSCLQLYLVIMILFQLTIISLRLMLLPMKNYSRLGENEKNGIVQVKQIDFDSFSETLEKSQIVLN